MTETKSSGMTLKTGLVIFLIVLVADQITKQLALANIPQFGVIEVTSFFNLVLVWNTGVSFGLFQNEAAYGRWLLIGLAFVISGVIIHLLRNETHSVPKLAYWLVLAGALGNVIDRIIYGAVIDFLDFHINTYHWPAFNIADSAIVVGAGLLIVDTLTRKESKT